LCHACQHLSHTHNYKVVVSYKFCYFLQNLRVGVLRHPNWEGQEVSDQIPQLEDILQILKSAGVSVEDPIEASAGTLASVTTESGNPVSSYSSLYFMTSASTNLFPN